MIDICCELSKLPDNNLWKQYFNKKSQELTNINSLLLQEKEKYRDILDIYPSPEKIFSAFFYTPLQDIKVVILGQDPYHNPGEAWVCVLVFPKIKRYLLLLEIFIKNYIMI